MSFCSDNALPALFQRSYNKNNYVVIGEKEESVVLSYESKICNINCFSLMFTQCKRSNNDHFEMQKKYIHSIIEFLSCTFSKYQDGYIVFKKYPNKTVEYKDSSKDLLTSLLKSSNHLVIKNDDKIKNLVSPGASIKNQVKYAYISNHRKSINDLRLLSRLYDDAKNLIRNMKVNAIRGCRTLVRDSNKDNLIMDIMHLSKIIRLEILSDADEIHLKFFFEQSNFQSVTFTETNYILNSEFNILKEIEYIFELNRLALLIERDMYDIEFS